MPKSRVDLLPPPERCPRCKKPHLSLDEDEYVCLCGCRLDLRPMHKEHRKYWPEDRQRAVALAKQYGVKTAERLLHLPPRAIYDFIRPLRRQNSITRLKLVLTPLTERSKPITINLVIKGVFRAEVTP